MNRAVCEHAIPRLEDGMNRAVCEHAIPRVEDSMNRAVCEHTFPCDAEGYARNHTACAAVVICPSSFTIAQ